MATSFPDYVTVMPGDIGADGETIGPVDYGCVRRYRHRRLITYLWLHGFRDALRGLLNETDALMSVAHLSGLVLQGLWDDAVGYVSRFLPPDSHPQSDEAQVLLAFLKHHKAFASIVTGGENESSSRDISYFNRKYNTGYLRHDDSVSNHVLRMRSIFLSLLNSQQVRASLDWDRVRHKASRIVQDLAYKAPELKDLVLYPAGSMMSPDVLPIGFRYRTRRRFVKEQHLPGPKTLTKIFLRTRKRIPPSTRSHELKRGLTDKTRKWIVDVLDESLQAGSLELQSSGKKGIPGATVSHTMSNTLTALTRNSVSGTSLLANADALVNPVSHIMSSTVTVPAKISGAPVAAVSQTMNLTSHAENSGISTVINADESLQAGSLGLQPSLKKGVAGATVSHTMSNTSTDLTTNSVSGTTSLENAGALVEHP